MFMKQLDLTTALRPQYLPDEVLLYVQDNVGLYEGKYKLQSLQNGQVYLTSHRICYVDRNDPRKNAVALDLKDIDSCEHYGGFLKSSPKVTLIPKLPKHSSLQFRTPALSSTPTRSATASPLQRADSPRGPPADPTPTRAATWVCTICSFSNPVPSNFDPQSANAHTALPPCLACGIKPTLAHVLKAAVSNASNRPALATPLPVRPPPPSGGHDSRSSPANNNHHPPGKPPPASTDPDASFECPRCTFKNHPSLQSCEMCGAPLISRDLPPELNLPQVRTESPGPVMTRTVGNIPGVENPESVKISFRGGGDKIFYERLKESMTQRKWLLQDAPPIPKSSRGGGGGGADGGVNGSGLSGSGRAGGGERVKAAGIAGLEMRGMELRKNNELVIGSAFEDLDALMASAKEIIAVAESFARRANGGFSSSAAAGASSSEASALAAESASQLGLVATKDIVGGGSESLYLSELSRNLAEFLTDDARGVLRRAGGIISLVDLWAMFNRARGGVELVSPHDFEKAARLWEKLRLPVRLRTFRSGVLVVQARDRTDEATIKALLAWLRDRHDDPPERYVPWDWQEFGRGVTAHDVARRFGWSIGVAEEELSMAEERGVLCREEGIEGLKFWENYIDTGEYRHRKRREAQEDQDRLIKALKEAGFV